MADQSLAAGKTTQPSYTYTIYNDGNGQYSAWSDSLSTIAGQTTETVYTETDVLPVDQGGSARGQDDGMDDALYFGLLKGVLRATGDKPYAAYITTENPDYHAAKQVDFSNLMDLGDFVHENNATSANTGSVVTTDMNVKFTATVNGVSEDVALQYSMKQFDTRNWTNLAYGAGDFIIMEDTEQVVEIGGQQYLMKTFMQPKNLDELLEMTDTPAGFKEAIEKFKANQMTELELLQELSRINKDALKALQNSDEYTSTTFPNGVRDDDGDGIINENKMIEIATTPLEIDLSAYQVNASGQLINASTGSLVYQNADTSGTVVTQNSSIDGIYYYEKVVIDTANYANEGKYHQGMYFVGDNNNRLVYNREQVPILIDLNRDGTIDGVDITGDKQIDYYADASGKLTFDTMKQTVVTDAGDTIDVVNTYQFMGDVNTQKVYLLDRDQDGTVDAVELVNITNGDVLNYDRPDIVDSDYDGVFDQQLIGGVYVDQDNWNDYDPLLDLSSTTVVVSKEYSRNDFNIIATIDPLHAVPDVSENIVMQDAIQMGSDGMGADGVKWSVTKDGVTTSINAGSDYVVTGYGTFTGNSDGTYGFVADASIRETMDADIAAGKTPTFVFNYEYTDGDGDVSANTVTFNFNDIVMANQVTTDPVTNLVTGRTTAGTDGNDYIVGTAYNDELHGGKGADVLVGSGVIQGTSSSNTDKLYGEDGNDILYYAVNTVIDGGTGTHPTTGEDYIDTLYLNGYTSAELVLSDLVTNITHIEKIDMRDPSGSQAAKDQIAQTLTITAQSVLDMSDNDALIIDGDSYDIVNLTGFAKGAATSATDPVGTGYTTYTNGSATVYINDEMTNINII